MRSFPFSANLYYYPPMAVSKKKVGKKLTVKSIPSAPMTSSQIATIPDRIRAIRDELRALAEGMESMLDSVGEDHPLPQELLLLGAYLPSVTAQTDSLDEQLKLAVRRWKLKGGFDTVGVAGHDLAVVKVSSRKGAVRPEWKEVAADQAQRRALATGEEFDRAVFEDDVRKMTRPSADSVSVKFFFAD